MENYSGDTNLGASCKDQMTAADPPPPVYNPKPQNIAPTAVYPPPQHIAPPAIYPPPLVVPPVRHMWTTGLFGCLEDPENAILTLIAPCITYGQIAEVVNEGQTPCLTSGCIYCISSSAFVLPMLLSTNLRARIRGSYNLAEDPGPDLFVHLCFEACALCQEYRELKNRGLNPGLGWAGIQMARQYPGTMIPPQPGMMNRGGVV